MLSSAGLSVPANHVPHQGSTQISAVLHWCTWNDIAGQVGLSRGKVFVVFHGVSSSGDNLSFKLTNKYNSYENPADVPKDPKERRTWAMSRKATVELTQ